MAKLDVKLVWNGDKKKIDIDKGVIEGLIYSTNLVQAHAKTIVPVAPVNGGTLRGSIVKNVENNKLEGIVSTNVEYAPYVELGLKSNPNYPRQPYMRPALFDNKDKIRKIFIREGKKAVDK